MFLVRKNLILHREIHARGVHQINYGQTVFQGDFLRSQILLSGNRKPGARFYRSIIGDDNTLPAFYSANSHDHTTGRTTAVLFVHSVTRKTPQLKKGTPVVNQIINALPRRHFPLIPELLLPLFTSAFMHFFLQPVEPGNGQLHGVLILVKLKIYLAIFDVL